MDALARQDTAQGTKKFTYSDYLTWEDTNRWELIDGVPRMMAAPVISHQSILEGLRLQFGNFFSDKRCQALLVQCDVRLNHETCDNTVVHPNLLVVCDPEKLKDGKSVKGAPDLVVEILPPSSSKYVMSTKFELYKQAGVCEYWIVEPNYKMISVYIFKEGKLIDMNPYGETEKIPVHVLEGCEIDLSAVFEEEGDIPA